MKQVRCWALHDKVGTAEAAVRQLYGSELLDKLGLHLVRTVGREDHVLGRIPRVMEEPCLVPSKLGVRTIRPCVTAEPCPWIVASNRFIGGEPMKLATNRVSGRS